MKNDNDGLVRAVKDITAGSVGGIAQVLTGQPFDIVKVPLTSAQLSRSVCKPNHLRGHGSMPEQSIVSKKSSQMKDFVGFTKGLRRHWWALVPVSAFNSAHLST